MTDRKPGFSIITCTFNSSNYLVECLESVKSQNFSNLEHIIVDGGSKDRTIAIAEEYRKVVGYPVKIIHDQVLGISHAMNKGIKVSTGEYICHLHSDDIIADPHVLTTVNNVVTHSHPQLIVGDCSSFDNSRLFIGRTLPASKISLIALKYFTFSYLLLTNKFPHPSVYVHRSIFKEHGLFDEELKTVMDYEYWLRITRKVRPYIIEKVLSKYRFHSETFSEVNKKLVAKELKNIRKVYKKAHPYYSKLADLIYNFYSKYQVEL